MSKRDLENAACPVCNVGRLRQGTRTLTLERDDAIVVIKEVPGWVCGSCGEGYSSEETTDHVLKVANSAFDRGAEVEVLGYQASRAA